MFHPSRGGVRGGKDQFNWEDVKNDKHRENYLGHSLMAPVGRWQKGKDLTWYAKDGNEVSKVKAQAAELARIKEAEAEAMAVALGVRKKKTLESHVTQDDLKHALKRDDDSDGEDQPGFHASEKGLGFGKLSRLPGATGSNAVEVLNNGNRSFAPTIDSKSRNEGDKHKKKKKHKKHHKHKSDKKRHRHHRSDEESEVEERSSKHRRRHHHHDESDDEQHRSKRHHTPEERRHSIKNDDKDRSRPSRGDIEEEDRYRNRRVNKPSRDNVRSSEYSNRDDHRSGRYRNRDDEASRVHRSSHDRGDRYRHDSTGEKLLETENRKRSPSPKERSLSPFSKRQ